MALHDLIETTFQDNSNYVSQPGTDILGAAFTHPWGSYKHQTLNFKEFVNAYPDTFANLDASYLSIIRAFSSGAGQIEVKRTVLPSSSEWQKYTINGSTFTESSESVTVMEGDLLTGGNYFYLRYPGTCPYLNLGYNNVYLRVEALSPNAGLPNIPTYRVSIIGVLNGIETILERKQGSMTPGTQFEGASVYLGDLLEQGSKVLRLNGTLTVSSATPESLEIKEGYVQPNGSILLTPITANKVFCAAPAGTPTVYYQVLGATATSAATQLLPSIPSIPVSINNPFIIANLATVQGGVQVEINSPVATPVTAADIISAYDIWLDSETTNATLLFDTVSSNAVEANSLIAIGAMRKDLCVLVGYPLTLDYSRPAITGYLQTLVPSMFSSFYHGREMVTYMGIKKQTNGLGTIAGRYVATVANFNINQLPSYNTGVFPGVVASSLSFKDIRELHELGANGVYTAATGPRIFGIRSLHDIEGSKYSRFNVMRVISYVLRYAFSVSNGIIHMGNTPRRRKRSENDLNFYLSQLMTQENLRSDAVSSADLTTNNSDDETEGGRILNVNLTLYPVSLTERVRINVIVTDTSTNAQLE